jgi:hypothetical protein
MPVIIRPRWQRNLGASGAAGGGAEGADQRARNKRTVLMEIMPPIEKQDRQLPLYRLLDRIADESLDPRYRDALCVQVLPFLHSRLSPNLMAKPPFLMSSEESDETLKAQLEHEKQVKRGRGYLHSVAPA